MKPQFIIMVGDDGVLFTAHGVTDTPLPFFAMPDEANCDAIMRRLSRHRDVPVTVLADTLAQDFRRESLPRVGWFDRRNLIERRLKQAFPQAGLSDYLKLGGRDVLLAGAHESGPVFGWLKRLAAHAPQLCLLPVECAPMVTRLMPMACDGWALLLSRQRTGGFRQIVTLRGELAFARLTPPLPHDAGCSEIAEAVGRDIKASLGYLARLGLHDASQLDVMYLMPEQAHGDLRKATPPVRSLTMMTPRKAALRFNLPFLPAEDEIYADLLYAGWLARHRARLPLMLNEVRQAHNLRKTRTMVGRAAMAASLAALLATSWHGFGYVKDTMTARGEAARLEALRLRIDAENEKIPSGESVALLRQAAERRKLFAEDTLMPWPALAKLNQGLGASARLMKLDWRNSDAKPGEVIEAEIKLAGLSADTDREKTVAQFEDITHAIARATPGYNLTVSHYPFPALPSEPLSGGAVASAPPAVPTAAIVLKKAAP